MNKIESGNISWENSAWRFVVSNGMALFPLRSDCERATEGIRRAQKLAEDDYAIIIVTNHFGLRDQEQAIKDVIFRDPVLKKKPVLSPIAIHQNSSWLNTPQKMLNVTLAPLVTESTMGKLSEQARAALILKNKEGIYKNRIDGPMRLNDGSTEFGEKAIAIIRRKGIIVIAAQGTEKDTLGTPDRPTISRLIMKLKRAGEEKLALFFVGIGIKNALDYQKSHVNKLVNLLLSRYTVNAGNCFTLQEIMNDKRVGGKIRNIDNFSFDELRKFVPAEYLQQPINH